MSWSNWFAVEFRTNIEAKFGYSKDENQKIWRNTCNMKILLEVHQFLCPRRQSIFKDASTQIKINRSSIFVEKGILRKASEAKTRQSKRTHYYVLGLINSSHSRPLAPLFSSNKSS